VRKTIGLAKYAGVVGALGVLSACGGSSVAPSSAMSGMLTTAARPNLGLLPRNLAMPATRTPISSSKYYEYIGNDYGTYVGIFDYPKSDDEIGKIAGGGGQLCTHVFYGYGTKTFWNVAGQDAITEYSVPKKPLKTLDSPYEAPSSCAMNSSGDLAVGILYGAGGGDVIIYKNASGKGKVYKTPLAREYFDGYDPKGNLFADGFGGSSTTSSSYGFELVELPAGGSKFVPVTTSNSPEFPGSVQWDGTYLVLTDQGTAEMYQYTYQYTTNGTKLTLKHTISLSGSSDCAQTWIATKVVYCADAGTDGAEVFKYPQGGSYVAALSGAFATPLGVVATQK
jgi:hypothetical protein